MNYFSRRSVWSVLLLAGVLNSCAHKKACRQDIDFARLEQVFRDAPDSLQTSVYWYWISDNISEEGVVKDLEAMKEVGINRAFIGNIGLAKEEVPYGRVTLFSEEWWAILHTALKRAGELGIEIGIFNSPGWSQSGGPWIQPHQAMRYLNHSDTILCGSGRVMVPLRKPDESFEHVKTLAFPISEDSFRDPEILEFDVISQGEETEPGKAFDRNNGTAWVLPTAPTCTLTIKYAEPFTLRSVRFFTSHRYSQAVAELAVKREGAFVPVKIIHIDRTNPWLIVGFDPYAPIVEAVTETEVEEIQIRFSSYNKGFSLKEIELSGFAYVERYPEKSLAKMHPTPLPYWNDYLWPQQPQVNTDHAIAIHSILDLTDLVDSLGILCWEVPEGQWKVLHTGMTPTGVVNDPASPEGTGLEVDKMSREHVTHHFEAFIGEILRRIPAEDRKTWKVVVADSYERGGQNWTDDFIERFLQKYGYDPVPLIPVLYGYPVGSRDRADRFLWDLRRMVADDLAYEYLGSLRELCHRNGLTIWLENYGHWGFPGEFLQYGGQSDEVAGEFWSEGELGDIENRAASSCAHIYGKTKVSAESFTCAGNLFSRYPALMKQRGDRFFTEGINNTLLHVYIQQPHDVKRPGINAWFGNEFNRNNTWFGSMGSFNQYLKRCNYMLQQGLYVADVAYFIGEDVPKMTGVCDPPLPIGYSFDYMNAEVILNRMSVKDGLMVLPDGMSYRLMVLPDLNTMRPEVLEKINDLVTQGATILGPPPTRSPGLHNFPMDDQLVCQTALRMWGSLKADSVVINRVGKGYVLNGLSVEETLAWMGVGPDFSTERSDSILFIHRNASAGDIYFLSNQTSQPVAFDGLFRVENYKPELWDAVTGSVRELEDYSMEAGRTRVPMQLSANGSVFVVFRRQAVSSSLSNGKPNYPSEKVLATMEGPWDVIFYPGEGLPEFPARFEELTDWTVHESDRIRYFSGSAVYRHSFVFQSDSSDRIILRTGPVSGIARIGINSSEAGTLWTAPWELDITDYLKLGDNQLEITVVNTWVNRLIGDSRLEPELRNTWCSVNPYKPDDPLISSGLLGPVQVIGLQ